MSNHLTGSGSGAPNLQLHCNLLHDMWQLDDDPLLVQGTPQEAVGDAQELPHCPVSHHHVLLCCFPLLRCLSLASGYPVRQVKRHVSQSLPHYIVR